MTDEGDEGDEPVGDPAPPDAGDDDATPERTRGDGDTPAVDPGEDTPAGAASDDPVTDRSAVDEPESPPAESAAERTDDGPTDADQPAESESPGGAACQQTAIGEESTTAADDTTDASGSDAPPADAPPAEDSPEDTGPTHSPGVPEDVRKYDRFQKIDGSTYERANDFLRERTYITAREWAIARLCADFRTETGVEMTKIGENLPELVPFMTDTYTPQAVNQARAAFEEKVRKAGATFLYGAMSDFFTAEELDDVMYESTEVAKFLLEVEGVDLTVEEELDAEDKISEVMREVREHSAALRHDEVSCPECGHQLRAEER